MGRLVKLPLEEAGRSDNLLSALDARVHALTDRDIMAMATEYLNDPARRSLLGGVLAGSSYIASVLERQPELIAALGDNRSMFDDLITSLMGTDIDHRPVLLRELRRKKRMISALVGIADLAGLIDQHTMTATLSTTAEIACQKLTDHLLLNAAKRGDIKLVDETHPSIESGIIILGMGKMGAFELNYSSDIDLIILFDHTLLAQRGCSNPKALTAQLARTLTHLLEQKTTDGYVFRADLRLRPNLPGNPLALSADEAELYYERQGQNWERAAHIKARPVAGDLVAGRAYLERLSPFLWRKHLDYAAIKDIQSIKRQINAHHGFGSVNVQGHDLKVGRGGIREIEFFCQTQQLILGGRHPELRLAGTVAALEKLGADRWIAEKASQDLVSAYADLRDLEHRLQMIADRQTHLIPPQARDFDRFARLCGHGDSASFENDVRQILMRVERHYSALFESSPELGGTGRLVFTGTSDDPGTIETLTKMGFRKPGKVAETMRGWHHGHIKATRSTRARELLTELTPAILHSFDGQADKDRAFELFDQLLKSLPAGVQLFSLFHANPKLLDLVSDLIGAAPKLIGILAESTDLFEDMLTPDFFDPLPPGFDLAIEHELLMNDARDLQDVLDLSRQWAHARQFQAGLQVFLGTTGIRDAARCLSTIAELMIERMLSHAETWLEDQHGSIDDGRFCVLGFGKLGSKELSIGSDLDLVFVYDAPAGAVSNGVKPLPADRYFARLGQRLVTALSTKTSEGVLYDIDTRLRPSGNAGPVACSLANFERYQISTAETWERQALTRARPVAGNENLAAKIVPVIDQSIKKQTDPQKLRDDVRAMRQRIFKEHGSDKHWNLKHCRGGLVELEFVAQFLQLAHAKTHPSLRTTSTRDLFIQAETAEIIDPQTAQLLLDALDMMHALTGVLRLAMNETFHLKTASHGLCEALIRAASNAVEGRPIGNIQALDWLLVETQSSVRQIFDRMMQEPVA